MLCVAIGTFPFSDREVFCQRIPIPATAAYLTARIHRWHPDDVVPVPHGFVFQYREELRPFAGKANEVFPLLCRFRARHVEADLSALISFM